VQSPEDPAGEAQRAPRGRPRESSHKSAESQLPRRSDGTPDTVTASDYLAGLREAWQPPDIWSKPRPGLADRWAYAARGEWTGDGALRKAGQAYALLVAFPAAVVCLLIDWTAERPSRLAAAALLLFLCSKFPPLSWLI
jgi:hypothetical protein